jgi:hypothetical protein
MLPSDYIALASCLVTLLLLTLGVIQRGKRIRLVAAGLAAAIVLFHLVAWRLPFLWIWIIPHSSVVIISYVLVWCAIIPLMVALSLLAQRRNDRQGLLIVCFLFLVYAGYLVSRQLIPPEIRPYSIWHGRVMMQSNPNTCVAAAASSLLKLYGVELTECDAVDRGHITDEGGNDMNAWRILRLSLPAEYHVVAGPLSRDDMRISGNWYLLSVDLTGLAKHEIVAQVAPDGKMARILDPIDGEYSIHWEVLADRWHHRGVWVEELPPPEAASNK